MFKSFVCCLFAVASTNFFVGCASLGDGETSPRVTADTRGLGLLESRVVHEGQSASLSSFRPVVEAKSPSALSHLQLAESHAANASRSFWIGLAGAVVAAVADNWNSVPLRTAGNAVWGVGWVSWMGFGGLAKSELRIMADKYNAVATPKTTNRSGGDSFAPRLEWVWLIP